MKEKYAFLHFFVYNKNNSVSIGEHFAKGIDAYGDEEDQNCSDAGAGQQQCGDD